MLIDDRSSAVSLPELPLLGVLPGTGGLTRVVDKRHVRRDRADYFSTKSEGLGGKKAVAWRLVDEAVPRAKWDEVVRQRAGELAARSSRPAERTRGHRAGPAGQDPHRRGDHLRPRDAPGSTRRGGWPRSPCRGRTGQRATAGQPGRAARAGRRLLDPGRHPGTRRPDPGPAHQRAGAGHLGAAHPGRPGPGAGLRPVPADHHDDWLASEIVLYLKRTLKRLDVTSRSLLALIEPGSCFAGSLLELALAADRSYMLFGVFEEVDPDAQPGHDHGRPDEPRPAADGQRPDPAADPVPGRPGRAGRGREAGRGGAGGGRRGPGRAWSRSPPTTSTGTRRSASPSRSGPASARTP